MQNGLFTTYNDTERLSIRVRYEMAVCVGMRLLLWLAAVSASCAVQVFILRAGLAEVHERRVGLETGALCRAAREMQSTSIELDL